MHVDPQRNPELEKVADMVKETRFAMLTSTAPDGSLHSRPMTTLQMDSDGSLWFFTAESSRVVAESAGDDHVNLCYIRSDKQDFLSISGVAQTVQDRAKMQSMWTPWLKPWFPGGLDDPDLTLLKVEIDSAEYWDAPGSTLKRLYGLAKARTTGNTDALGEHGEVRTRH